MIDAVIFSEHSLLFEKWLHFYPKLLNVLKKIVFFIVYKILFLPFTLIKKLFIILYYATEENTKAFKKKLIKFLIVINVLASITLIVVSIFTRHFWVSILLYSILFDVGVLLMWVAIRLYMYFVVEEDVLAEKEAATREFVKHHVDPIGKIYAETGGGKDELASAFGVLKAELFKEDMQGLLFKIKEIAYLFDYDLIEKVARLYADMFFSSSEEINKKNFNAIFKSNHGFLKPYYQKKIDLHEFVEDCKELQNNRVSYKSKWMYIPSEVTKKHYIEMAFDYLMTYIRLNIEKNILWTNQPFIEEFSGLTAKLFSVNYLITKNLDNQTIEDEQGKTTYEEKVLYPFKDYNVFLETECGSWYLNLDNETRGRIIDYGIRDFKAFNRHYMPHFAYYAVDQDANRMFKLLKELDHSYFRVDSREEKVGARAKNKWLELKLAYYNFRLRNHPDEIDEEKEFKKDMKIEYTHKLYVASSNEKYRDRLIKLNKQAKAYPSDKVERLREKRSDIQKERDYNEYLYGYIIKDVTISKYPVEGDFDIVEVDKKLKEFDTSRKGRRKSYTVRLYFKKSDCWRYDTHYMKSSKEYRAKKSELNMMDAPNWSTSLTMKKEDVKVMAYEVANAMFGVSKKEALETHYKPIQPKI